MHKKKGSSTIPQLTQIIDSDLTNFSLSPFLIHVVHTSKYRAALEFDHEIALVMISIFFEDNVQLQPH